MSTDLTMPQTADFVEKAPLERYVPPKKPSLVGLTRAALAEALAGIGVPPAQRKMRVQQIWHWIYVRGATRFDQMTSVSKDLHATLDAHFTLARPEVVAEQVSVDGTRKWLIRLPGEHDGERPHEVECVYIPETDRGTLCLSSQVGCTLTCTFCHTGTQRLVRNLTPGEIVGQVMVARDRMNDWPGMERAQGPGLPTEGDRFVSNIVMMGMGEPLYNFEAVRDAIGVIADGEGLSISKRRITLSTSGVVPMIARAGDEIGSMLAVSLHATRDELRNELVPLNRKYPIKELLDACRNYPGVSNARRITFEYVMLKRRERFTGRRPRAGQSAQRHPGEDQPHSVQSLARHQVRVFGLGADREILRSRVQRRLCVAGAYPARARHPGRLRPAQERDREALRPRTARPACHGNDRLRRYHPSLRGAPVGGDEAIQTSCCDAGLLRCARNDGLSVPWKTSAASSCASFWCRSAIWRR